MRPKSGQICSWRRRSVCLDGGNSTLPSLSSGIRFTRSNYLPITGVEREVILVVSGRQPVVIVVIWRVSFHRLDAVLAVSFSSVPLTSKDFFAIWRLEAEVVLPIGTQENLKFCTHSAYSLLLFADALEWRFVRGLYVHKLAGFRISFHPMPRWRLGLGATPNSAIPMPVPYGRICSHTITTLINLFCLTRWRKTPWRHRKDYAYDLVM